MSNKIAFIKDGAERKLQMVSLDTIKSEQILCQHAGKIGTQSGEVRYVSVKDVKRLLKEADNLQDNISGFMVPVPEISGLLWNEKLEKLCKIGENDKEILYELFDDEIEISPVRSWYYLNLAKYILKTYMLPLKRFCGSIGKDIIFDLGNIEMEYDLMKKMINPAVLKNAGLSLTVHKNGVMVEKELGFSQDDYILSEDFAESVEEKANTPKILLIKPIRGIMERFVHGEIRKKVNRLETPALSAGIESVYYCDLLAKSGYSFDVADEIYLPKEKELIGYENILICKSCLFTEKEMARLDKLQKCGVKINNKDLISSLIEKGEEEWEK